MKRLIGVMVALQVADLVTTYHALSLGGAEVNPLGVAALRSGFVGLVLVKAAFTGASVAAAVALSRRGRARLASCALAVVVVYYSGVVLWNLYQIGVVA